jgi:dipeptidyl aminopeptidase/acylaminoacyl peptidase
MSSEEKSTAPYGTWESPIAAASVGTGNHVFELQVDASEVFFVEVQAKEEHARYSLLKVPLSGGEARELVQGPFNVRTRVHEYGGGAFVLSEAAVYFSNYPDQVLCKSERDRTGYSVSPLTEKSIDARYADGVFDGRLNRIICVREYHPVPGKRDAINSLVSLSAEGSSEKGETLVSGNDFYSFPRLNSDATKLAWISWNFPNMPFDGAELWVGDLDEAGLVHNKTKIAGGLDESVTQPKWSHSEKLLFQSDRSGWWNLYRWTQKEGVRALCPKSLDFCKPDWYLGLSSYALAPADRIVCTYSDRGIWRLAILELQSSILAPVDTPFTDFEHVHVSQNYAVFLAASPTEGHCIYRLDLSTGKYEKLYESPGESLDPALLSLPISREFPTSHGLAAHSFYFEPRNPRYAGPKGELPPLIVMVHGGPTSGTTNALRGAIPFFTSRGFAVLDVNYGGSSGYGREYRRRLNGQWGVVDVEDCVNGALSLVQEGRVDGKRIVIRGGSAGGFTTLAALTMHSLFKAGACYYGISDLERWELDCHKFESEYLHSLIGAYPQERELFLERSPTTQAAKASGPLILFQGLDDRVVPPSQSELMVQRLRENNQRVEYVPFEEEQHDFRQAKNIARALELELALFQRALGLT